MVGISRAFRRRAERERKKREKKQASKSKAFERELKRSNIQSNKKGEPPKILCIPWNEESPKCPNCASEWNDEGNRYSCRNCNRFTMKTDLVIADCERCGRHFIWDALEAWMDDEFEEHELCSDCISAILLDGDVEWLKKDS